MNSSKMLDKAEKPLVLIVDDLPKNLQVLGNILKKVDCRVAFSTSGKQALEMMSKLNVDLVLLDIIMPEMDGYDVCRKLKADPATSEIPVIFLTAARKESDDIVKGFRTGAVDYITKPINEEELIARVNTHLELKRSRQTIIGINHEQRELLHILCHDLANPLAGIDSLFDLVEEDMDLFGELFSNLRVSVKSGLAIIDLVRDMNMLVETDTSLALTSFNLLDAVLESQMILANRFKKKNVTLLVDINKEINVMAERTSFINSVLNNILTNALKFSHRDSKIEIAAEQQGPETELSVRDKGIGIPAGLLDKIFEVGKSISRTGTDGETGTGFGMRLVQKFVTAYGGTIEIASRDKATYPEDHGTDVIIRISSKPVH